MAEKSYSYEQAGVSIAAGNALVKAIAPLARATARPGADAELGGFGGFFDLKAAGYTDPLLVAANDGVGTKVKLAIDHDRHDTIGQDLVAMCVNDLIVQGAEPLLFLDYFATGKLENGIAERVVAGIADGCKLAGCALIGGETAEMPGMYAAGDYDLAGFCVGAVERGEQLTGDRVAAGDVLLGLASSGVHSNGYSLVRRLAADKGWKLDRPALFDPERLLIDYLIEPTRIYVKSLLPAVRSGRIHALAHITGGGLLENVPRVLPAGLHARIDVGAWAQPRLMAFLQAQGNIEPEEMARTFNCGIGMVLAVAAEDVAPVRADLEAAGETVHVIGAIEPALAAAPCRAKLRHGRPEQPGKPRTLPERAKVAVLISGSGTNMAALLYASRLLDCPYEIVLVASNRADATGLMLAEAEGIATTCIPHKGMARLDHDLAMDAAIRASGAQYVALAGYMRILTPEFVSGWEGRMLNIHPSLLPKYKGLDTHQRALDAGDSHGGCTVHLVTAELDDGPILGQIPVAILPGDSAGALTVRVLFAEHQLYSRCLAELVSRATSPEFLTQQVRERALALPESDEVLSHGMACFGVVKGKKFAYVSNDHHGDGKTALLVKISGPDEQAQLIENDPHRYYRPAYFGDGWIAIRLDLGDTDWDGVADWLARSWRSVAPKRLTALIDAADSF